MFYFGPFLLIRQKKTFLNSFFLGCQGRLDAVWALLKRQYDRVSLMRPTSEDKVSQSTETQWFWEPDAFFLWNPTLGEQAAYKAPLS